MSTIKYILIGVVLVPLLIFGLLKLWFYIIELNELKDAKYWVNKLKKNKTPKLTNEEQIEFLNGDIGWEKIKNILNMKEIPLHVLNYFIDIEPDLYLNHLLKNPPKQRWNEGMYEDAEIKTNGNSFQICYYDHGKLCSTKDFETKEKLLRFLVYDRLTNIGYLYKKKLKKNYYA